MKKCDACQKKVLFAETFGSVTLCSGCFGKTNGFLWKCSYDRYEDAERQRCYALGQAHKNGFPQTVLTEINNYFMSQIRTMHACGCCGEKVQHLQQVGVVKICDKCFKRINISAWKKTEFEDNKEVETCREKVLAIAEKNNYPESVIQGINQHFNKKLQTGLLCAVRSDCGQRLKVFTSRAQIFKTEDFDREEMATEYGKLQFGSGKKRTQANQYSVSNFAKDAMKAGKAIKTVSQIVRPGGVARATVNLALSLAEKSTQNAKTENADHIKGVFKATGKSFNIDYNIYDCVEYQKCGENEIGFIRFINSGARNRREEDVLFFFDCDDEKIEEAYDLICECVEKARKARMKKEAMLSQKQSDDIVATNEGHVSVADEILKFKNLLDMGAITQEEYDAKKEQLLKQ